MPSPRLLPLALAIVLGGCSTIIDGPSQTIRINSDPIRAHCALTRDGQVIAEVITPGRVEVDKTKHDIQAVCSLDGYDDKMVLLRSGTAPSTLANIIMTAGIGWTVDTMTGADNSYPEVVTVILRRPKARPAG